MKNVNCLTVISHATGLRFTIEKAESVWFLMVKRASQTEACSAVIAPKPVQRTSIRRRPHSVSLRMYVGETLKEVGLNVKRFGNSSKTSKYIDVVG